ncbi:PPOX class F420-dependent oxidoreductase [Halopiger xanaduensis]|uniref:Putative F420-dependent enzyme n=1 Tax=Halopiger xanaduensis (strain DSM 18323 / JCM 14033 / SH-6) TaxID=797210 RepID=F8DCQ6_HALXS|nr:PPOX class F420-dependent oxidoreductase [Halopiger xanaduensis]AEH37230.1 putative F420-dependent enzyme [Halopiger xanaduensis SH-6]
MGAFETHSGRIPDPYLDILETESFGHVATLGSDGHPHSSPVWVDHDDGEAVLFNTLRGRTKERNIRSDSRVSISVVDPDDPYRYVSVRGRAELTEEGADEHIDELARQYLDVEEYPHHDEEDESRVIVRIPAEHVVTRGREYE